MPGADLWLDAAQAPVIAKTGELREEGTVVAAICGVTLGLTNAGLPDHQLHASNDPSVLTDALPWL